MSAFTDQFGGSTLQAAQVAYVLIPLSAVTPTVWPAYYDGSVQYLARLNDIVSASGGFVLVLPDATQVSPGQDIFFYNVGAFSITIKDNAGNSLATIAAGQQRYIYLVDNSTAGGTWRVMLFGVGASSPDASQLAGYGLTAIGATLNQSATTQSVSTNTSFTASNRAQVYINTGGTITGTLPAVATVGNDFFIEVRNQGSGTWTISGTGGQTVDSSSSIVLQPTESCFLHACTSPTGWFSVGRGRNTAFNFTELTKSVIGGTTTLSLSEAQNVVQIYTGTLTSNQIVVLPALVQVYYIQNATSGAYTFTLESPTPGTLLTIATGQTAVVICDGTNVYNASTSIAGISSLLLNAGSVGAPSLAISGSNNGFWAPSSTQVAVSANGAEVVRWSAGQELAIAGTVGSPPFSFQGYTGTGFYLPSANTIGVTINGSSVGTIAAAGWTVNALTVGTLAGLIKGTAGLLSAATAGTDYTTPTGTEALSNKTISASRLVGTTETQAALSGTAIDLATANAFSKTLSGSTTFTVTNGPAANQMKTWALVGTNIGTNVTWMAGTKWAGGVTPTFTVSGVDVVVFVSINDGSTTTHYGNLAVKGAA